MTQQIVPAVFIASLVPNAVVLLAALPIGVARNVGPHLRDFHGRLRRERNAAVIGWMRRAGLLTTPAAH